MKTVPKPSRRAKRAAKPRGPDFNPPLLSRAWFAALRTSFLDVMAVADDQTRSPGQRDLGRRLARGQALEAGADVEAALGAALVSLGGSPDDEGPL